MLFRSAKIRQRKVTCAIRPHHARARKRRKGGASAALGEVRGSIDSIDMVKSPSHSAATTARRKLRLRSLPIHEYIRPYIINLSDLMRSVYPCLYELEGTQCSASRFKTHLIRVVSDVARGLGR